MLEHDMGRRKADDGRTRTHSNEEEPQRKYTSELQRSTFHPGSLPDLQVGLHLKDGATSAPQSIQSRFARARWWPGRYVRLRRNRTIQE